MTTPNEDISEQLTQRTEDLSITDNLLIICANCGKEGNNPNTCNKCDLAVQYCNASCKKRHRSKHKKDCENRIAELHKEKLECEKKEAELHDETLFKQPPPAEDCPICMLLLPSLHTGYKYKTCCGKDVCSGCVHAVQMRDGVGLCPFCRTPTPDPEELVEQLNKRMEIGDAAAIYNLGCWYSDGSYGFQQDHAKALELWHRAAELGNASSNYSIGGAYYIGNGVESDEKKANHYYELASMGGDVESRYNLGAYEYKAGNMERALKHFMIAAGSGDNDSLENIKQMFMNGDATKDDYAKALRSYQAYLVEIKSPQRDEAATADERYKYY